MKTAKQLKTKNNVDSTYLSEAVKEYLIPASHSVDGVRTPISLVARVDPTKNPVSFMRDRPWGDGTVKWVRDATANDSDKTFTVPAGKIWDIKSITALISCTATVGNRSLVAIFNDGASDIFAVAKTASITAGQTGVMGVWQGAASSTSTNDLPLYSGGASNVARISPIPTILLAAGYTITVKDVAAIDPAADDMTVVLHYVEYDA